MNAMGYYTRWRVLPSSPLNQRWYEYSNLKKFKKHNLNLNMEDIVKNIILFVKTYSHTRCTDKSFVCARSKVKNHGQTAAYPDKHSLAIFIASQYGIDWRSYYHAIGDDVPIMRQPNSYDDNWEDDVIHGDIFHTESIFLNRNDLKYGQVK